MPGHGLVITSSPTCPRTGSPCSPKHSAAMPGIGPVNAQGLIGAIGEASEDSAGDLGAAGVVDDRDPRLARVLEEPAVRLRIPRLTGGSENAERRQVVGVHRVGAMAHERAHRRGRKAHHADAVALDQAPQPIGPRMVRHALEHDGGAAVEQRGGERHRPHEPAEVRQPEQPVLLADVHAVREVVRGLDEEAAMREHGPFRPARRPGRVDDEARPVSLDRQRRRPVILAGEGLVPPVVAPPRPGDLAAEATIDEHRLDRWALGHGLVGRLLQFHDLTAAVEAVGRDQEPGLAVGQTGHHGARAEPGEARRVDGADLSHREHRRSRPRATSAGRSRRGRPLRRRARAARSPGDSPRPPAPRRSASVSRHRLLPTRPPPCPRGRHPGGGPGSCRRGSAARQGTSAATPRRSNHPAPACTGPSIAPPDRAPPRPSTRRGHRASGAGARPAWRFRGRA